MTYRGGRARTWRLWVSATLLAGACCGCSPKPAGTGIERGSAPGEPDSIQEVIARVNRNAAGMDFVFRGGVTAAGEYRHGDKLESFELHGPLLYRRPKNLYLKLEHVGGTLEAGSNEDEFWLWEKFQSPRYSWGRHDRMVGDFDADLPLRPDLLAEVLGLGDLSADTKGPLGPAMWVGSHSYELIFLDRDESGRTRLSKAIDVDRHEPFLVKSLVYFRHDGRPVVQVGLDDYGPIAGSAVLMPRRIRIDWLPDRGWVELRFTTMQRFDKPEAEARFRSPLERGLDVGEIRRVDRPTLPGADEAVRPAPQTGAGASSRPTDRPGAAEH